MFDKKNVASIASWLNLLLPENKRIYLRGKCRLKTTSPCQGVDQRIFSSLIITQLLLFQHKICQDSTKTVSSPCLLIGQQCKLNDQALRKSKYASQFSSSYSPPPPPTNPSAPGIKRTASSLNSNCLYHSWPPSSC